MSTKTERRTKAKDKKKHHYASRRRWEEDSWSDVSTCASDSNFDGYDDHDTITDDKFIMESYLDQLTEKRASTRVEALKGLIEGLQKDIQEDFLENSHVTLASNISSCIRKGQSNEISLAIRVYTLACITMGPSGDGTSLFQDVSPHIRLVAKTAKGAAARSTALQSLAITVYFANPSNAEHYEVMQFLEEFWRDKHTDQTTRKNKLPPNVMCSALKGWAFLASFVASGHFCREHMNPVLHEMKRLLQHNSLDVKIACGEIIGLIYSNYNRYSEEYYEQEDEEEFVEMDDTDIRDIVMALTKESSKSKSKKEKKEQKSRFRDVLETIDNLSDPEETVVMHDVRYSFDNWSQVIQLDGIKTALQSGFHAHFARNEGLHETFHVDPSSGHVGDDYDFGEFELSQADKSYRKHCRRNEVKDRKDSRKQNRKKKMAFLQSED